MKSFPSQHNELIHVQIVKKNGFMIIGSRNQLSTSIFPPEIEKGMFSSSSSLMHSENWSCAQEVRGYVTTVVAHICGLAQYINSDYTASRDNPLPRRKWEILPNQARKRNTKLLSPIGLGWFPNFGNHESFEKKIRINSWHRFFSCAKNLPKPIDPWMIHGT